MMTVFGYKDWLPSNTSLETQLRDEIDEARNVARRLLWERDEARAHELELREMVESLQAWIKGWEAWASALEGESALRGEKEKGA